MVTPTTEAAAALEAEGISAEVVDLRSLVPLDEEAVLGSVRRTGRAVIVHEAARFCGFGAELSALLAEKALYSLRAPVLRVTGYDTPVPYVLENVYLPDSGRIASAARRTVQAA
jgi:pyruvate/2-oxoglutarate/acetoin dehydrogenase E1 component